MMTDQESKLDFSNSPHILPLRDRTEDLLQVLLPEFTLRKNRPGPGVRLLVEIEDRTPSIVDRDAKREFNRIIRNAGTGARDRLESRLADFFRDAREREYCFDCSGHPLRYVSGGVLPVVRLDGREYFWLFYRDVFPIGWNIANGHSDTTGELLDPSRIVLREFGEEVIVTDFTAEKLFTFEPEDGTVPIGFQKGALAAWSGRLNVDLSKFERSPLVLKWVDGPDSVEVSIGDRRRETDGLFVNITPRDNAIELDRIVFVNLGEGVTLLDGEHRNGKLLNQIIGLFEIEKIRDLSRTVFLPDVVYFDGGCRRMESRESAGRLKEFAGIVSEYLRSPTLQRTDEERREYIETASKYDLCPITRAIVPRFFEWETSGKRDPLSKPPQSENPEGEFDVFVAFRNPDLEVAQGLASYMRQRGLSVFMSSETLKQLGEADYFRAINEALEQSAVLVVVGSRAEWFAAGWVKYEWQSFLSEINGGRKDYGRLFTFSGGVSVDELPFALRQRQSIPYDPFSPESSFDTVASFIGPRDRLRLPRV